jgi:hypothetical protein
MVFARRAGYEVALVVGSALAGLAVAVVLVVLAGLFFGTPAP